MSEIFYNHFFTIKKRVVFAVQAEYSGGVFFVGGFPSDFFRRNVYVEAFGQSADERSVRKFQRYRIVGKYFGNVRRSGFHGYFAVFGGKLGKGGFTPFEKKNGAYISFFNYAYHVFAYDDFRVIAVFFVRKVDCGGAVFFKNIAESYDFVRFAVDRRFNSDFICHTYLL